MNYNTSKTTLIIPEYGRYIHDMVYHCMGIEDREKRNHCAKSIIEVMGNLNPHLRDVPEFQHKLWDQLFIISDFGLDVDSPFPISTKAMLTSKPNKIYYPKNDSTYRYYGMNIKKMIQAGLTWEDDEKRKALFFTIANQMKKNYITWNKDQVDDLVIFNHLFEFSGGKIDLKLENEPLMNVADAKSPSLKKRNNINNKKKIKK
jgi:hypothetical protein